MIFRIDNPSSDIISAFNHSNLSGQLTTIGYSLLNLFCSRGTVQAASSQDTSLVLNAGALQLPIHIDGPDAGLPLTMESLKVR